MRRPLSLALLATLLLLLLALPVRAKEDASSPGPLTPERVARMILIGSEGQQVFVSYYLERADRKTLRAVQKALRAAAPALAREIAARRADEAPQAAPAVGPVPVVTIESRILQMDADRDPATVLGLAASARGTLPQTLDPAAIECVLRAVEKSTGVTELTAPRITVYDRQRANVSVLEQVSYIRDFDVEVKGENWIADPVVGVVQAGVTLDLRPVISKDAKTVTLDVDMTWAALARPIRERRIILHDGAPPMTIQLPELDLGSARATVKLEPGHAVLLASPAIYGNGKTRVRRYAVVSVRIDTLDAGPAGKAKPGAGERREKQPGK